MRVCMCMKDGKGESDRERVVTVSGFDVKNVPCLCTHTYTKYQV